MHAPTRIAYARELLDRKRHDEAIELLRPVTEAGSNDRRARALAALGQAYAVAGRGAEARDAFEKSYFEFHLAQENGSKIGRAHV